MACSGQDACWVCVRKRRQQSRHTCLFGEGTTGKADDVIGHGGSENGGHARNDRLYGARIASGLEDEPEANIES